MGARRLFSSRRLPELWAGCRLPLAGEVVSFLLAFHSHLSPFSPKPFVVTCTRTSFSGFSTQHSRETETGSYQLRNYGWKSQDFL